MAYVIGAAILVMGAVIAVGTATGRMQARGCCCPSDPMQDTRMRPYLLEDLQALADEKSVQK